MKKNKVTLILFLMIGILLISVTNVNAHSVELDPNSLINFPMMISNGKGNITIKSSESGYSLYYQAVEMSNTAYAQIQQITNNGKKELDSIDAEIEAMDKECDNLRTVYDEAYETYKEKMDSGVTDTELETFKKAYETAKANYQNKVTEYNNKVKEYTAKSDEIKEKINELTPTYIENKWIKTEDKSFKVDLSQFSGDKAFAIWVKLISSDGTISYDEATYTMSGTKTEDIKVEGISLDITEMKLTVGSSYTSLKATINPSDATDKLIIWTSDNENIATVSNGKVTAKSPGTATITATTNDGNYTATCKVTVSEMVDTQKDDTTTNVKNDTNTKDTTTATGKLPQTGVSMIIVASLLVVILIAILYYKKYYNYRDIK